MIHADHHSTPATVLAELFGAAHDETLCRPWCASHDDALAICVSAVRNISGSRISVWAEARPGGDVRIQLVGDAVLDVDQTAEVADVMRALLAELAD